MSPYQPRVPPVGAPFPWIILARHWAAIATPIAAAMNFHVACFDCRERKNAGSAIPAPDMAYVPCALYGSEPWPYHSLCQSLFIYRGDFFRLSAIQEASYGPASDMADKPILPSRQPMQKTWKPIAAAIAARIATQSRRRVLINSQSLPNRARPVWLRAGHCVPRPVGGIMGIESGRMGPIKPTE